MDWRNWRSPLVGWRPSLRSRLEAIALRLEAIASRYSGHGSHPLTSPTFGWMVLCRASPVAVST